MLKVLHRRRLAEAGGTYHDVVCSNRRRYTIESRRGSGRLLGVPDKKKDRLFWREWRRYMDVLRFGAPPTAEEIEAYRLDVEVTEL